MDDNVMFTEFVVETMEVLDESTKAEFIFHLNGTRIVVSIFERNRQSEDEDENENEYIENRLIDLLEAATDPELELYEPEDNELFERSVDEVANVIMDVGEIPFSQIAPPLKQHFQPPKDLHHALYPETFDFRLETIHDTAFMIPISSKEAARPRDDTGPDPNLETDFEADPLMPRFPSKDIIIEKEYRTGVWVRQVKIGSETMLCKAFPRGLEYDNLKQELINLQAIAEATSDFDAPLRIPLLRGYVTHAVTGAIIGLLRSWIPPSQYGNTIQDAGRHMATIPVPLRRKWLRQVTEAVKALHGAGLFWGDGKADNICIDPEDNAWLIDMAGGFTQNWVSKDIAGTKEGDNHSLLKLKAFLWFNCPELSDEDKRHILWISRSNSD
ncbi:hypothetical protein ACHAP5_008280 [Fusarium lateritium]